MAQQVNHNSTPIMVPAFAAASVTMSSREIAELTEKQHKQVLRDVRSMLISLYGDEYLEKRIPEKYRNRHSEYIRENGDKIFKAMYGHGTNWNHDENQGFKWERDNRGYVSIFHLDRDHTECLLTGYSVKHRMRVIKRWRELEERAGTIPRTLPEALRLAADMAEQNAQLTNKVRQDAPKVAFVDRYVESAGSKSLRETAKILNMPEKAMIDALRRDSILFRQSGYLLPHARHQSEGLFTVKTGAAETGHAFTQTRVTPKGVQWIAQRYASELIRS